MSAYPRLACLLFALAGCGGITLVGSSGGTSGAGGSGSGTDGGTCTQSPGDRTISTAGRPTSCAQNSDCALVYAGDLCASCTCPFTAIAASGLAAYQAEATAKSMGCCDTGPHCFCPAISYGCLDGTCVTGGPNVCYDTPSPVSCTAGSCPPGYTCTPDSDPSTCHPSECICDDNGHWLCDKVCVTKGSTCVKGG
jgi:hypothetical protein